MDVFSKIFYTIKAIPLFIKKLLILFVRFIEFALTGQSEYNIYRGEIADFDIVIDLLKAKILRQHVEKFLSDRLDIKLKRPVVLELFSDGEFNLKGIIMQLDGSLGRYHPEKIGRFGLAHMIYVRKGLTRNKFMSILAHEMAHAFLKEEDLLPRDRYLREGFARWVEHLFLVESGEIKEAEKLYRLKTFRTGKAVESYLELEKKIGVQGVMEKIRNYNKQKETKIGAGR
jgi:hypothetical protein